MSSKIILFQSVALALLMVMGCRQPSQEKVRAYIPHFNTVKEVEDWCATNLKYQNDDPWDPAPDLQIVFDNKHGDCKMLAGAVYEALKSVGQDSKIVTVKLFKKQEWYLHMIVLYKENENWRVIDNAKLRKEAFMNLEQVKKKYGITDFIKICNSYDEFQNWFNKEIYPRHKKH